MGSKVRHGQRREIQGPEVKTQVGHIAWLGWGTGHPRERSKVIFGWGSGEPLPQIMTVANSHKALCVRPCSKRFVY